VAGPQPFVGLLRELVEVLAHFLRVALRTLAVEVASPQAGGAPVMQLRAHVNIVHLSTILTGQVIAVLVLLVGALLAQVLRRSAHLADGVPVRVGPVSSLDGVQKARANSGACSVGDLEVTTLLGSLIGRRAGTLRGT